MLSLPPSPPPPHFSHTPPLSPSVALKTEFSEMETIMRNNVVGFFEKGMIVTETDMSVR